MTSLAVLATTKGTSEFVNGSSIGFYNNNPGMMQSTNETSHYLGSTRGYDNFSYISRIYQLVDGRKLYLPLRVEIEYTPSQVSVTDLVSGIFGVGLTLIEAQLDFVFGLNEYRESLTLADKLSPYLKQVLDYLNLVTR